MEQMINESLFNSPKTSRARKGKSKAGNQAAPGPMKARTRLSTKRYFTTGERHPLDTTQYRQASSAIKGTDGAVVFGMDNIEVPQGWSQLAVDILVSKYFRRAGVPVTGHEMSIRQTVGRISRTIRKAGIEWGYFDAAHADIFEEELSYMLVNQIGAFNSPVWFNLGLYHEYGIGGQGGNYAWDPVAMRVIETKDSYSRPQCSACFIQSVDDDLMGIFKLMQNEARLFKYGSGTGSNFSKLRGSMEKLSGGGLSSGLMSFLEVIDRGAGATKSGGTTRRAAKMVCLDLDHPEIVDFITWKSREEKKVAALIAGGYSADFNGEAYRTVSGQNSNNSVRVTDEFMNAIEVGGQWNTRKRTTGEVVQTYEARQLWRMISEAAWSCADPGVQFDTHINKWHTCKTTDRINASNPCSEYMFLDDSACNLSSLNLVKFLKEDGSFDVAGYRHACEVFVTAQEILVDLSSYPTDRIAKNSHDYRPLGLGFANLGTLLMLKGIPYDSEEGRTWAASLTAIMCGRAYYTSALEAKTLGPFAGYEQNRESMLEVIGMHRDAAYHIARGLCPNELVEAAREDWDLALETGKEHGYRNAQVTVLAPTGTIGLLMDCDTTGVEPDFALVKFKKLSGGGYFKIVNNSVPMALSNLGYTAAQTQEIITYVLGSMSLVGTPHVNREWLLSKGLTETEINKIEKGLPGAFELSGGFTKFGMGEEVLKRIGVSNEEFSKPTFNFLRWAGLTEAQIAEANGVICGTMTVEGAPHLKEEHLAVFDCANKCGKNGKRYIAPMGHVRMMAAVQPFLSGAISKTVNLPNETRVEEIEEIYTQAWKLGLKAIALYRDGSKHSQPLSTKSDTDKKAEKKEADDKAAAAVAAAAAPVPSTTAFVAPRDGAQMTFAPVRRKLPSKRSGFTQEARIAGHKVFLRTGEFEDGSLGELFIDMHKEGAAYRSMMNCFAISVSLGLQYGVPVSEFVDKFTFTRFEPSGMVEGHPNVKMCTSLVDYIFRVVGMEYLGRTDFLQVKPQKVVDLTGEKDAGITPRNPSQLIASGIPLPGIVPQMELSLGATSASNGHLAEMMGDAPPCDSCGHTTVRNGACYKCLNCGTSMGCS